MRSFGQPDGHIEIGLAVLITGKRVHQLLEIAFVVVLDGIFNCLFMMSFRTYLVRVVVECSAIFLPLDAIRLLQLTLQWTMLVA